MIRIRLAEDSDAADMEDVLADMDTLNAQIALPMFFERRLNGFIVLGEKKSGDLYSREDLDLLETLAGQSALAIENARSYRRIEDLNVNLEHRVKERTRDLKQALKEKERTQEQLIQSESLAAIGQLVAGAAHELNNPLTSVTSLVQATIEDLEQWDPAVPPDEDMVEDLQFADRELRRARNIVASLLGLSRQTQTYEEAVDLNMVVKDALRVLHNQYKYQDLEIKENYYSDLPDVQGNFSNLGQVALNIIKNAIQAVPLKKGKIVLTTRIDPAQKQIVFECRDNGPGIARDMRRDIFKPFFTTKPVGKGTGLGLYICHEIISKHGGSITLENAAGQGALFRVRLPVVKQGDQAKRPLSGKIIS
ncbi:MAG: GAF domain-containing protein [Deltaproteobacteria bacterium]|nr:GAF domain-containing protein [Deltaproteobacteria bacterium]